jgi:hypothetical protein
MEQTPIERPISPGDIISIQTLNSSSEYTITKIDPDGSIMTTGPTITSDPTKDGIWHASGITEPYSITFREGVMYQKDIAEEIINHLPTKDVVHLCLTSTWHSRICNNDLFWKKRIEREFGEIAYKPASVTYYQYYLARSLSMNDVAKLGRLDLAQLLERFGKNVDGEVLFDAYKANEQNFISSYQGRNVIFDNMWQHLEYLKLLHAVEVGDMSLIVHSKYTVKYADYLVVIAAKHDQLDLLVYLYGKYPIHNMELVLIEAMKNSRLHIIHWLGINQVGPRIPTSMFYDVIVTGNLRIIDYLCSTMDLNTIHTGNLSYTIGVHCDPAILDWLVRHGLRLPPDIADYAVERATSDSLQWLYERGYLLTSIAYRNALSTNSLANAQWLFEHGVVIEESAVLQALMDGTLNQLKWLEDHNANFNIEVDMVANLEMVKWILPRGAILNVSLNMSETDDLAILQYLWEINYIDRSVVEKMNIMIYWNDTPLIKWIIDHGGRITLEHLINARMSLNLDGMEYIYRAMRLAGLTITRDLIIQSIHDNYIDVYWDEETDPLGVSYFPVLSEWLQYHNIPY